MHRIGMTSGIFPIVSLANRSYRVVLVIVIILVGFAVNMQVHEIKAKNTRRQEIVSLPKKMLKRTLIRRW